MPFPCQTLLLTGNPWILTRDGDLGCRAIYERHYSHRAYKDGRRPVLFVGPGEKIVLCTPDYAALFVWRKFIDDSGQYGVNCAVFRNEMPERYLSSALIVSAEDWARKRWPGERLYTYVNQSKIASSNPGFCFIKAGWRRCGKTRNGLVILEKYT